MRNIYPVIDDIFAHITKKRITIYENGGYKFHIVLSHGNNKIGRITNFSVMPGKTCAPECMGTCYNHCYDMRAVNMYPTVKAAREANTTAISERNLEIFAAAMEMYLSKYKPEFFRIHVGGDFVRDDYFKTWCILADAHPETTFLAYTKQYDRIRYALNYGVTVPDNFMLYISLWNGITFPLDLMSIFPTATLFEDNCHKDPTATVCPGSCATCMHCYTGRPVVFIPHGNGISKKRHAELEAAARHLFRTYHG